MTAQEIVHQDLLEIYIGNLNTVDADLKLPSCGKNGTSFTWESKHLLFISHEGKVTRPTHGVGNRKVDLEVTGTYQGYMDSRTFEVTVLEEPGTILVKEIRKVKTEAEIGKLAELPPVVIVFDTAEEAVTRPVVWDEYEPLTSAGNLSVSGRVEGTDIKAEAEITYVITYLNSFVKSSVNVSRVCKFPYGSVRLKAGSAFAKAQERMITFLKDTNADQMLYNFRQAAGLDTNGALPMTGWDAPECNLKGHTTGHFLSGIALAYSASGDPDLKTKADYMIHALGQCQQALEQKGWHKGFLSAYGEEQFDLLEIYTRYPEIWAPYYTLDKIMCGLYDCYEMCGNEQALEILCGIGDWIYNRLSRLPKEQRDKMWAMYIAGEYGGIIWILVKLYRATGVERYCEAAGYFWNEKLFYPMAEGVDTLKDMHSNQHIPQIIGALEMYRAKGDERNYRIVENFWNFVTKSHSYVIGGNGENEMFHQADHLVDYLSDKTAESCSSYNMLRLTAGLFQLHPHVSWMDYYETVLLNHTMATMSHACDGGTTYFLPLRPGGWKEFGTDENTCCHGTGMESRFRYIEDIYLKRTDMVYVNLYIPSEIKDSQIHLAQHRTLGSSDELAYGFRIIAQNTEIAFRVPGWTDSCKVLVNGIAYIRAEADGYIHIRRDWEEQDVVEVMCEHVLKCIVSPDDSSYVSLAYGPYILAEVSEEDVYQFIPDLSKAVIHVTEDEIEVKIEGRRFIPLEAVVHEKYHVYLKNMVTQTS